MDRVSRLIVCLLLLFCGLAHAATYTAFYTIPGGGILAGSSASGSTIESAAAAYKAARQAIPLNASCSTSDPGAKRKVVSYEYNSTSVWFNYVDAPCSGVFSAEVRQTSQSIQRSCPTGTLSGTTCTYTCPSGQSFNPSTGLCRLECPAADTQLLGAGTVREAGNGLSSTICLAGCEASAFMAAKQDGKNYVWGPIRATGRVCSELSPGPAAATETSPQCPVGKCPRTLNGSQICVPCAETKQDTKASSSETAASAASGAAPGPGQTTTQSGSSSTTCSGDTCTTTGQQTVQNPDGSTETKSTTTTQSKGDYCKENPKAGACVGSESTWGGTCGSFTCDGDAVQCAQARAGWELACALKVDETNPLIGVGQQATAGGDRPPDHPGNQANTLALDLSSRLSSVPLFGTSGDCIADKSITFMGKGYTLPFSKWCPYLNILGSAFLAACYLAAAFIIFRD